MADLENQEFSEEARLMEEGTAVLDFNLLCSTVALQTQGKWGSLQNDEDSLRDADDWEFGGIFRMWEGEVFPDYFEDHRIAMESTCCPCYRFGKNMKRAGFGSCFLQGIVHFILALGALVNLVTFVATKRHCFLYLAVVFSISFGAYLGYYRAQMKRKFNIKGKDSFLDDWMLHLFFPCCTLAQESRTLEMNNVYKGTWHGRGDTICIGSYSEGSKAFTKLSPPVVSTISPEPCFPEKSLNGSNNV